MSDILASSITLEDILTVAEQKRVPIAPELAGYLTLELADAVNAASATGIDPKTVYVSEEGSVALVKSKLAQEEDVESSLRKILGQLLTFSGSQTPALAAVVKRKSGSGPRALVTELEAALIPVNRAAGRRALARMAREARRISLGLGRAGALSQGQGEPKKRESRPDGSQERGERRMPEEAPTAQRPRTPFPTDEAATVKRSDAPSATKIPVPPMNRGPAPPPPPLRAPPPRKPAPLPPIAGEAKPPPLGPAQTLFGGDEVDSLLSTFGVTGDQSDKGMSTELKALVGLEPTPPPPGTAANFEDEGGEELPTGRLPAHAKEHELTAEAPRVKPRTPPPIRRITSDEDSQPQLPTSGGDGIEDLLAMTDDSSAIRPPASTAHPIESDELPAPIAVAMVKADSNARVRKAKDAAKAPPPLPPPESSEPVLPVPVLSGAKPEPKEAKEPSKKSAASAGAKVPPSSSVPSGRQPRAPKTTMLFLVILLVVLAAGAVGIWKLAPGFFTGRTPEQIQKEKDDYEAQKKALEKAAEDKRCKASLVVTGAPAGSEVLLRVGQAPVAVPRMPMKARLEFVATAEGFAPKRATVLPTAPWDTTKSPPRFDLAVQLDPSKVKAPALDPWPSGAADIEGQGDPGSVYVVSTPPGAEIWLLVGLGPEARIDQLKCDDPAEVLVAGSQVRKRMRVAPGEAEKVTADATGSHVVTLVVSGPGSAPSAAPSGAPAAPASAKTGN